MVLLYIQILHNEALKDEFIKHHQLLCTVPLCIGLISGEPVVHCMLIYRVELNTNEYHMIQCNAIVLLSSPDFSYFTIGSSRAVEQ